MFYDIDILNRRGGKFGMIWLAANKKLRLKGKGSKNDLRLLLQVRVDWICQEIVRYVRTVNPGTEGSSPRFSLYLSAMLTHGAIIAHHKQVSHTLANVRLTFQQRATEKKLKESNISCDVLDLSDAVIGVGKYLLSDGCSLEDSEFGCLVAVVDALKIPSIYPIANESRQAPLCEEQLNCPASPGEIERLFAEMEVPSGIDEFNINSSVIYVSPSEITLKEIDEPLLTMQIDESFNGNEKFGSAFDTLEVLSSWNESNVEQIQLPGPSNLRRSNSKRVIHDDSNAAQDVPIKQSRTEPAG
ncbi:REC8-like protein copy B [Daphnia pulex]|nr:REC8-like protein copy B [Daphnia pulex]|eukprot:EFX86573.1 REC8-like protein copy B [Daphnia pulex]